jgi:hypothetical protein
VLEVVDERLELRPVLLGVELALEGRRGDARLAPVVAVRRRCGRVGDLGADLQVVLVPVGLGGRDRVAHRRGRRDRAEWRLGDLVHPVVALPVREQDRAAHDHQREQDADPDDQEGSAPLGGPLLRADLPERGLAARRGGTAGPSHPGECTERGPRDGRD